MDEHIRRSASSLDLYDLLLSLFSIINYSAGVYGTDLLQKLASERSDEQIDRINSTLTDYLEELSIYRGETEGTPMNQILS